MSNNPSFNVNFGGKFVTLGDAFLGYEDGLTETIVCSAEMLFSEVEEKIPVPIIRQRIWFKFPYEDFSNLKLLWSVGDNFQKMCEAAKWISVIDIYMEDDGVGQVRTEASQRTQVHGNRDRRQSFEEDSRVEAVIADIQTDDEENEGLPATPNSSDIEEEEEEEDAFERWKRGSGELKIRQVFSSVEEFKEGCLEYALKGGWNIKYARWGPKKSEAICAAEDNVIAKMFINELRYAPAMQPKEIQQKIKEKYNLEATDDQIKKAKKKALNQIQAEDDEQYSKIKEYDASKGRKKNPPKKIKEVKESPTKGKKVTSHGRTMHCHNCGVSGHYQSKCPNAGVTKKRKRKTDAGNALAEGDGPSPSQPTQRED